jgi:hypothetical protein
VKIFRANPWQRADGVWVDRSNDVEVTLYVPLALRPDFQSYMQKTFQELEIPGAVEWISSI